jgi:hypothetical protein
MALAEQRITSVVLYRAAFTRAARASSRAAGTRESDIGVYLPYRYWYPIDRDEALERRLAAAIENKLRQR